jgi:hypothetical protein
MSGNFLTYEITIANSSSGELDLSTAVSTEKTVYINPGAASVRFLATPSTSTTDATASSYLLDNSTNSFDLGPGLDRLSIYNGSGGEVKVSIAVMF